MLKLPTSYDRDQQLPKPTISPSPTTEDEPDDTAAAPEALSLQDSESEDEEAQPNPPRASGGDRSGGDAARGRAAGAPTNADAASATDDEGNAGDGGNEPARDPSATTTLRDLWEQNDDLVTELNDNATEAERRLCSGQIEQNDGRHLHGDIDPAQDKQHMEWFDKIMANSYGLYDIPRSAIGKQIIITYTEL